MTGTVRRAGAFAAVGTLAVVVPAATGFRSLELVTVAAIAPFVLVAALGVTVIDQNSRLFDLFARPGDYEDGKLYGLAAFSLAAAGHESEDWRGLDRIVEDFAEVTGWTPDRAEQVAGAYRPSEYDLFKRFIMRRIIATKDPGADLDTDREYTDWPALDALVDDWIVG